MNTATATATQPTALGPATDVKLQIADLQNKLLSSHPLVPTLLRTIHQQLKADPEIVTLLEEEEINVIVSGLQNVTKVKLIEAAAPKKKACKNMTLDDF